MQSSSFKATGEKALVGFLVKELLLPQVDGAHEFSLLETKTCGRLNHPSCLPDMGFGGLLRDGGQDPSCLLQTPHEHQLSSNCRKSTVWVSCSRDGSSIGLCEALMPSMANMSAGTLDSIKGCSTCNPAMSTSGARLEPKTRMKRVY